jgi:uncharacterized protein YjbJ (UPF0337 family)
METRENKTAETFKVSGNWEAQSKQLKSKFSQLTDSDLKFETGKESELLGRIQTKLKKNRQEVIDIIQKGQSEKSQKVSTGISTPSL